MRLEITLSIFITLFFCCILIGFIIYLTLETELKKIKKVIKLTSNVGRTVFIIEKEITNENWMQKFKDFEIYFREIEEYYDRPEVDVILFTWVYYRDISDVKTIGKFKELVNSFLHTVYAVGMIYQEEEAVIVKAQYNVIKIFIIIAIILFIVLVVNSYLLRKKCVKKL